MYKNHEGYPDPTAGEAIRNVMREYRKQQRLKRRKQMLKDNKLHKNPNKEAKL